MDIRQKINVAGITIELCIDQRFPLIQKFFTKFYPLDKQEVVAKVHISKDANRNVEVSKDFSQLLITGDDIDNLTNPFNLIGIVQAVFRFSAIHLAKQGVLLLHGSASILNNRIICFGDDGSSTAKTLSSLETALISNYYIADEFCFLDTISKRIFGYSFIPIHIRPVVKEHLEIHHNLALPPTDYTKSEAGYFIEPHKLFNLNSGKLDALVYVHFSETENQIVELPAEEATEAFKICAMSHVAKLFNPELDKMQFASRIDSITSKIIDKEIVDDIAKRIFGKQTLTEVVQTITSYKLNVSNPCKIIPLLKAENHPKHS